MSLTANEIEALVKKCMKDEHILIRPTRDSAKLYGVNYDEMLHIRRKVRHAMGRLRSVKYLRQIEGKKEQYRVEKSLSESNILYPGVLRDIHEGANLSALARKFDLTRQRVHQIKVSLIKLRDFEGEGYVRDFIYITLVNMAKKIKKASKKK